MVAGGELGHHAAIALMHRGLRVQGLSEQAVAGVIERDARLVAGGFDAEDAHGGQSIIGRFPAREAVGQWERGCFAMERFDVAVIGAGAAGLYCAGLAGQRGRKVVLLDHSRKLAEKIRISGGGRCNFTNRDGADPTRYLSADPAFAATALAAHRPEHFIAAVRAARIGFHEKHRGQLFCDDSSQRIIDLLRSGCVRGQVALRHPVEIGAIARGNGQYRFEVETSAGRIGCRHLVVATGGLSIPALGASDFAWRLARAWGLATVAPRAALVPFRMTDPAFAPFAALSGLALPVSIGVAGSPVRFDEDLLLTHRGLSGPAALQISSYWRPGAALDIDLLPGQAVGSRLRGARDEARAGRGPGAQLITVLAAGLPRRFVQTWLADPAAGGQTVLRENPGLQAGPDPERRIAALDDAELLALARALAHWMLRPAGTEGYRKAEVTAGGIATAELDPRTLEAHRIPGSYWIGEAVDVTGWLGGYNFQWAWSSAWAAAAAIAAHRLT